VGNLQQPVARLQRLLAASEGAVGVEEGRLRRVLGIRRVAQDREHVPVDLVHVSLVQALERAVVPGSAGEQCGAHLSSPSDAAATTILRSTSPT
jgi:hypothetical protein